MNFRMFQATIKCFERSTVERIEENSNDMSRYCMYQINTHKYGHGVISKYEATYTAGHLLPTDDRYREHHDHIWIVLQFVE